MRYLLTIFLFVLYQTVLSQDFSGKRIIDSLEDSKFYFVGQLHCNLANNIIEEDLFFGLNQKYGVQYNILEYSHSIAFIINEYLKSGQDSFLIKIHPSANFSFIKAVKSFNDSLSDDKKVKFYGLDFEGRLEGRLTRYAIQLITNKLNLSSNSQLFQLLQSIISAHQQHMAKNLENLRVFLTEHDNECRELLKDYFLDVLLIANAQYSFSPKRDGAMVDNFKRLYSELLLTNSNPRFFASFGTGHIDPSNRRGIAIKLLNDEYSPVRQNVSVIGVQYINSQFFNSRAAKITDGSLNFLCRNPIDKLKELIEFKQSQSISFISKKSLSSLNCDKNISIFSGLLVIQNYGEAQHCSWQ